MVKHLHLIVRAEVKKPFGYEEQALAFDWLVELTEKLGMKILSGPHVAFTNTEGNKGISACVLIHTSHCCLNVWHEEKICQFDVYTCGDLDINMVFEHMKVFEPVNIKYKFIDRETDLKDLDSGVYKVDEKL